MGLSDLYYKLEEKYYASLDWLDSKGLHFFYKVDEWLNAKNIPSFPIMTLLSVILLAGIIVLILFLAGAFGVSTVNVTMQFVDVSNNVAVPNLNVALYFNGDQITETTNANGELELSLPKDVEISISVGSDRYALKNSTFVFSEDTFEKLELLDKSAMFGPKALHLYTDLDTKALFSGIAEVDLTCSGNPNYIQKKTVVDGIVDVNDLPDDCGELIINSYDLGLSESISASSASLDVLVSSAVGKTGTLRVIVQDKDANPLAGISVAAFNDDGVYVDSSISQETGLLEFTLPIAKYFLSASDSGLGDYSPLSTKDSTEPGCYSMISENEPTVCTITMTKSNVGKINLLILDVSGKPVKDAQIKIYKNDLEIFPNEVLKEESKGVFQKGVAELGPYRVVIDSPQYMVYDNPNVMASETSLQVVLEAVKAAPVLSVIVTANSEPVANATVQLSKEGNLILTKQTGADGIAYFDRLETGKVYSAKVIKGEYSATSKPITLDARVDNKLEVAMIIGKGNIDVSVFDKQGNASVANVELYNVFTDKSIGSLSQTDAQGIAHFTGISADKTVYAKLTTAKGTSYSLPTDIQAGQTTSLVAYIGDDLSNLSFDLIGLYNLDGTIVNTMPKNVLPSTEYYALYSLNVPKGKPYSSGNVFFIGNGKSASESDILIKNVSAVFGEETKGLTYTPKKGLAEDMLNKTSDDALWSSLNLSKVNAGQTLVKVSFIVSNDPKLKLFNLGYRANLKTAGTIYRYPQDDELGINETSTDKLGFYADTENLALSSGSLICSDIACIDLKAQDDLQNVTQIYNDDLYSLYNSSTVLSYKIVPATKQMYKNLTLEVSTKNSGLNITSVSSLVNSKPVSTNKESTKYLSQIGTFTPTSTIEGTIAFIASKTGDTLLTISLLNENKEVVFTKEVKVVVDSPKNLVVEFLPSTIVPYVLNLGAVVVTDSEENLTVSDALVNVYLNDVLLTSGKTDGDGKVPVQIEKPNAGDTLKIKVNAPGYNEVSTNIKITENILVPNKPEIVLTIDKSEAEYTTSKLLLQTTLPYTLKVKRVAFSANQFSDYVNVKVLGVKPNQTFDYNIDMNISAELTDLGKALLEPKEFVANLDVVVQSEELDKIWNVVIPVNVYVKMYGALDATNCLNLDLVSTTGKEFNFKLTNTCLSSGEERNLYNANVSTEWIDNKIGEFTVNGKGLDLLDENFILINTIKPKGKSNITNNFKLGFVDNSTVVSGVSKVNVVVTGYYPMDTGLQEIKATKEITVSISDYKKCLQIISPSGQIITAESAFQNPVVLGVTQYGMGYNMLNGMYGAGLTAANGYPLGMGQMMGLGGAATYMQNGNMSYNTYDQLTQGSNMSSLESILAMQQGNQYGAFGTSDSFNNGMMNNGLLGNGLMNNGLTTGNNVIGYDAYGNPVYNNGLNSNGLGNGLMGNAGAQYYQNPSVLNQTSRNTGAWNGIMNNGQSSIIQSDSVLPEESKILFDYYPTSPMVTGMVPGMSGLGAYGMGSPYAMGQYGAMMQSSLLPTYNKLQVINKCNTSVNLEVRAMPQILVSPNTFALPTNGKGEITVMSNSLPGTYTMNILVGNDTTNLLPLISIPVNVIDYASNTAGPNCFKLSEEPVINMSSAYKRNKIIKVYNYCYSKGVIFNESQPIQLENLFTLKEVNSAIKDTTSCNKKIEEQSQADCKDEKEKSTCLAKARKENKYLCDGVKISQNQPYASATPVGVPQVEYSGTYGQYQSIDVILEKDPTIQRLIMQQMGKGSSLGDTVSKISSLRSALADLYSNVEFPALFVINARIGYGPMAQAKSIQKFVTVRDMWNVLAAADIYEGLNGANKNCTPNTWDKNNNLTPSISDELPGSAFNEKGESRLAYPEGSYDLLSKDCFGSYDDVIFAESDLVSAKDGKGNEFKMKFTPHYSKFQVWFDVLLDGCIDGSTKVEQNFKYTIKSNIFPDASAQYANQKLKLIINLNFKTKKCFENGLETTGEGSGDNGSGSGTGNGNGSGTGNAANNTAEQVCQDNYGTEYHTLSNYGFGKEDIKTLLTKESLGTMLNFTYNEEPGSPAKPECTKTFCDAEQLKWFLTGKFKEINVNPDQIDNKYSSDRYFGDNLIMKNNVLLELSPKDVLDPVSLYYLEKDVRGYKEDSSVKKAEFDKTFKNMPNIFFKKSIDKLGAYNCNGSNNVDFNYNNYCYFNAVHMISMDELDLNAMIKQYLSNEFDVVVLSSPQDYYYLFDKTINPNGGITYAYLRPDNYKLGLTNKNMFGDKIESAIDNSKRAVGDPAIVLVKSYLTTGTSGNNAVELLPANYYLPKDAKEILEKNFLYNLPIDPAKVDTYKGEYGLCVEDAMVPNKGLFNFTISNSKCDSTVFAKILSGKVTEKDNSLFFRNTGAKVAGFELQVPNCKSGADCKISTNKNTTITYKKEDYYLSTIFRKTSEYCYRQETGNYLEIKYVGNPTKAK